MKSEVDNWKFNIFQTSGVDELIPSGIQYNYPNIYKRKKWLILIFVLLIIACFSVYFFIQRILEIIQKCEVIMKKYNEEDCKKFYKIAKKRMAMGYSEKSIFDGKPEGFSEWLKETWKDRINIKPQNDKNPLVRVCNFCGKK